MYTIQSEKWRNFWVASISGASAAAVEIYTIGQPSWAIKTLLQDSKQVTTILMIRELYRTLKKNPGMAYRGALTNLFFHIPTIMTQTSVNQIVYDSITMPLPDLIEFPFLRRSIAALSGGYASGFWHTVSEQYMTLCQKQTGEYTTRTVVNQLKQRFGTYWFLNGTLNTCLRNSFFGLGYLCLTPALSYRINQTWVNGMPAMVTFASGLSCGMLTAAISQPFDMIKTTQQLSLQRISATAAARNIHQNLGLAGFFRGTFIRGSRAALATATLGTTYQAVSNRLLNMPLFSPKP